jgi:hypothetical protein
MGGTKREYEEHLVSEDQLVIADAVLAHAKANYKRDGWDAIVELYSRHDIAEVINRNGLLTVDSAITYVHGVARRHEAMAKDVTGKSF